MTKSAYTVGSFYASGLDPEIARLRTQLELTWPAERALLERVGLAKDTSILEIGSGPGFVTEKLLALAPAGSVTAVEVDADMAARADGYLRGAGLERYAVVRGDICTTDLPAGGFDVAFARYVMLHLPDPLAAMRQALRLLKPGGTLVTLDIDITLDACEPRFPEFEMMRGAFERFFQLRGTDPYFGRRKQRRLLGAAGFERVEVDVVAVDSDEVGSLEPFVRTAMDPDTIGRALVATGLWSSEQLDRYARGLAQFVASEDPYLFQARPVAWGRKPT